MAARVGGDQPPVNPGAAAAAPVPQPVPGGVGAVPGGAQPVPGGVGAVPDRIEPARAAPQGPGVFERGVIGIRNQFRKLLKKPPAPAAPPTQGPGFFEKCVVGLKNLVIAFFHMLRACCGSPNASAGQPRPPAPPPAPPGPAGDAPHA